MCSISNSILFNAIGISSWVTKSSSDSTAIDTLDTVAKAGVQPGDRLVSINGRQARGFQQESLCEGSMRWFAGWDASQRILESQVERRRGSYFYIQFGALAFERVSRTRRPGGNRKNTVPPPRSRKAASDTQLRTQGRGSSWMPGPPVVPSDRSVRSFGRCPELVD